MLIHIFNVIFFNFLINHMDISALCFWNRNHYNIHFKLSRSTNDKILFCAHLWIGFPVSQHLIKMAYLPVTYSLIDICLVHMEVCSCLSTALHMKNAKQEKKASTDQQISIFLQFCTKTLAAAIVNSFKDVFSVFFYFTAAVLHLWWFTFYSSGIVFEFEMELLESSLSEVLGQY